MEVQVLEQVRVEMLSVATGGTGKRCDYAVGSWDVS